MNFKRTSTILLSGILAAATLAGCGEGAASSVSSGPSSANSAPANAGSSNAESAPPQHAITVLGKDRRYDCLPFADRDQYPTWQAVEKLLADAGVTCTFEVVPKEQYATVIKTRMAAASDLPDVVNLTDLDDQAVLDMGKQGLLVDVKAAIDQYSNGNTMKMWDKYMDSAIKLLSTSEGKIFWYPGFANKMVEGEPYNGTTFALQYRVDWLNTVGLTEPATLDDVKTMLKAFRDSDANGNGAADEIALVAIDAFNNGVAQSFGLAPNLFDIENHTDKAVTPWLQPGIKPYLEYMKSLVEDGVIDASLIGATAEVSDQKVTENKAGLLCSYAQQTWYETMIGLDGAEYAPILPKAADGIQPAILRENGSLVYQKFGVTKNCKDLEGAVRLFDTLYTEDYAQLCMWGVEDIAFKWENNRKVDLHPDWTNEQRAEAKVNVGHHICGHTVFPVCNIMEEWKDQWLASGVTQKKIDFDLSMQTYQNDYSSVMAIAMPTDEESELTNQYMTTLDTYSKELLVNLILGNTPMEKLDDSIAEMKEMGLTKILEAFQTRHDRYTAS